MVKKAPKSPLGRGAAAAERTLHTAGGSIGSGLLKLDLGDGLRRTRSGVKGRGAGTKRGGGGCARRAGAGVGRGAGVWGGVARG